ncbi:hypothetical protein FA95DRAFT_1482627 [Auriscalpium vulgare]|uniref:Uncharacterized protein n=1 Tax=Auriscalpium vulgare TaxID=40419 RepID=A0ACB8S972_9AGAM|nr:hypothetical protein FA95DRAFT_1482627 [Auriscalpium vulgare]
MSYHPLHPDILPRLDPEYAAFHNEHLVNRTHPHEIPWDPSIRNAPTVPGSSPPLKVGGIADYSLSKCKMRVFTPEGPAPVRGWPVFIFFHGGGWTLGSIDSENAFATNMCKYASCVVVSVDYRLAPEHPFPAAVEDAIESLEWVWRQGKSTLDVDLDQIAIGGSSSGGNLAAVLSHKATLMSPPIPLVFQLLVVPVTDNTAAESGTYASWTENAETAWLPAVKMVWYRQKYLPNAEDWPKWESSPILAPDELFPKSPKTWVAVTELDVLRDEGIAYGQKLMKAGVEVEIKVYKGAPHPIMAMDGGVLTLGKQLVSDAALALAQAFGTV